MADRGREWLLLHLEENAGVWHEIAGEVDASSFGLLGRLEAVSRALAAMQRRAPAPCAVNHAELTTRGMLRPTRPEMRRSPTELRRLVGQSSAGMTRILAKLQDARLIRRLRGDGDGRRRDVVLTAKGAALAEEAFAAL